MIEIRFHGRGGQGAVTAAEILATAAFFDGRQSQAFPFFGVERTGAPVQAFCRISDDKIRLHQQVYHPDVLVVLDDTLLETVNVFEGLKEKGKAVVASKKKPEEFPTHAPTILVFTVDAYAIAREKLGRPIVNTALLGALAKATELVSLESLDKAVKQRFPEKIAQKNVDALKACFDAVIV
ncbi:MAG: pyruvate ferredoxin oxidoreductase subunit gamma [Candidatus Micrarchaeia archaeon]